MIYCSPGYFNKGKYDFGSVGKDQKTGDGYDKEIKEESINKNASGTKKKGRFGDQGLRNADPRPRRCAGPIRQRHFYSTDRLLPDPGAAAVGLI